MKSTNASPLRTLLLLACLALLLPATLAAEAAASKTASKTASETTVADDDPFAPFAPFVGKTWKGEMKGPDGKTVYDVSRWERALGGKALRNLHSINEGDYGGETIVIQDPKGDGLIFYYFTTAGFYTHGTVTFEDGKFVSREQVEGNEDGITEVEATAEVLDDGRLRTRSRYLKQGEWVEGHGATYVETPGAEVIFKDAGAP